MQPVEANEQPPVSSPWRTSVAPMLDWTDRHCRYFHRLLTQQTRLYTEMVTTGALTHGHVQRHLRFNQEEHPVALQLGGSEPADLATAASLGLQWGYDEINLNCGCPSERVQRGAFGACLMAEPHTVAEGVKAMMDAVKGEIPVTVKHRIGIDRVESYGFVRDFVGTVADAGCRVFIVHARNAWLQGLSPKDNREIPPLRYDLAYRLKNDFPGLTVVVNGGITTTEQMHEHLSQADGVMLGREAYYRPWAMTTWDATFHGLPPAPLEREAVEEAMVAYMDRAHAEDGCPWYAIARHMLGLYHGERGARLWRQVWSDHRLKPLAPREVWKLAQEARRKGAETPVPRGPIDADHATEGEPA
jgi:tRNA-dihydrouridine synthase A